MFQKKPWLISILLIVFDVITIYIVFRIATFIRIELSPVLQRPAFTWAESLPLAQLSLLFIISIFLLKGLYPGYGLTAVKELEWINKSISLAFFLVGSVSYLNKPFQVFPRSILLLAWVLSAGILPAVRFLLRNILSKSVWYGTSVKIFGDDEDWSQEIVRSLKYVKRLGWVPGAIYALDDIEKSNKEENRATMAILAPNAHTEIEKYARILSQRFRKVVLIRKTDNFGSLWVQPRDLNSQLGLEFHYHLLARRNHWIKRSIDLVASGVLLILLSPFFFVIGLLIFINNPGPIFFHQERLGKDFKPFKVIKFRTMVVDAEQKLHALLENDAKAREQYKKYHKLDDDPRITKLGSLIRRYSIDELPQLWNVFRGEMSLSGPRAYMPAELDEMGDYAGTILRVLPGMTGWWQVLGRHTTTFENRLKMDEYYISNWSLWMDAYIFMKTIFVVLRGDGA